MVSIEEEISAIINGCGENMCILAACVSNEYEDDERFRFWVKGVAKYASPFFLGIINMLMTSGGKLIELNDIKKAINLSLEDCRTPQECLDFEETKPVLKEVKTMIMDLKETFDDEIWIISYEYMFDEDDVPPEKQGKYPPNTPFRKVEWSEGVGSEDFPIIQLLYIFLSEEEKIGIDTFENQLLLTEEQVELIKGLI